MRGDRPHLHYDRRNRRLFTPHARGSTEDGSLSRDGFVVYPACAGIDPLISADYYLTDSLPRMRGDRPPEVICCSRRSRFTPHARGSTSLPFAANRIAFVYPACAGIDLCHLRNCFPCECLPRMRGDRPLLRPCILLRVSFTPHARGSTWLRRYCYENRVVYPACAGIDRSSKL